VARMDNKFANLYDIAMAKRHCKVRYNEQSKGFEGVQKAIENGYWEATQKGKTNRNDFEKCKSNG